MRILFRFSFSRLPSFFQKTEEKTQNEASQETSKAYILSSCLSSSGMHRLASTCTESSFCFRLDAGSTHAIDISASPKLFHVINSS